MTQFDLTDFAGQKRDLRTMEPVAGEIGHCFVVGARHLDSGPPTGQLDFFFAGKNCNLGAGSDAGQVRRNFRQWSPHRTTGNFFRRGCRLGRQPRHFFPGKNPDLGAGLAGLRCRAGGAAGEASMPGRRGRVAQCQAV